MLSHSKVFTITNMGPPPQFMPNCGERFFEGGSADELYFEFYTLCSSSFSGGGRDRPPRKKTSVNGANSNVLRVR